MNAHVKTHLHNSLALNTYLLAITRALSIGFGFLFWVLAARMMSADNVGLASGTVSATVLLAGLAQLGLGYGIVRHLTHADNPNGLLNLSLVICGLAGGGGALIFLVGLHSWSSTLLPLRANLFMSLLFIVFVLSTALSQLLHWAFLARRRLAFSLVKQASQAFLAIILLFVLQPFLSGYVAAVAAYAVATILSLILSFWWFLPIAQSGYTFNFTFRVSSSTSFAKFSLINYVIDQFQRAPDTLLPLIILDQFGANVGAYFFVAWTIGRSIGALAGSVAESLFAEGSDTLALVTAQGWHAVKLGLVLVGSLGLTALIGGKFILSIYGQAYVEQGMELLFYIVFAAFPGVLLSIFVSILRVQDRLFAVFKIMVASITLGMLFSYSTTLWLGLVGVGVGWLISQTLVLLGVSGWWYWQRMHQREHILPVYTQEFDYIV